MVKSQSYVNKLCIDPNGLPRCLFVVGHTPSIPFSATDKAADLLEYKKHEPPTESTFQAIIDLETQYPHSKKLCRKLILNNLDFLRSYILFYLLACPQFHLSFQLCI